MNLKKHLNSHFAATALGVALTFAAGVFLLRSDSRLGQAFRRASYDLSFDLAPFHRTHLSNSEVVIVYQDQLSHKELDQPFNKPWDRVRHTQLVNNLTDLGARAVIFDLIFTDPDPDPAADQAFAEAIRENGNVLLAGEYHWDRTQSEDRGATPTLDRPLDLLRGASAGWGYSMLQPDRDFTVRRHFHQSLKPGGTDAVPSLVWAAARLVGKDFASVPREEQRERWVNYYGPPETIPHLSYSRALYGESIKPGFFKNKIVFVGTRPIAGLDTERRDEMRSPYYTTSKEFQFMPAVEVRATELLNLLRGDWLRRLPSVFELFILAASALTFSAGLFFFRPIAATGWCLLGVLVFTLVSLLCFSWFDVWFPWLIISLAQAPLALLCSVLFKSLDWYVQRRRLEHERSVADLQLREQAALLDKAQDAIIVHDFGWRASFWNKSAERIYGWSAEEILGQNLESHILDADTEALREARNAVLSEGEWVGELKQKTRAGALINVQSRWSLLRSPDGNPRSILVINTDMTEKKKLEAQFLRAQRMESIGTLAGGIAHDLNNVLSPILMGIELLQLKTTDDHSKKLLKTMGGSARRGVEMVKQVLSFARGHGGERAPLLLGQLVEEMHKIVRETFPKNIEIEIRVDKHLHRVVGDATQWHQVLLNLCVNARDAMPEGGRITVSVANTRMTEQQARKLLGARPIDYVLLSVQDNGEGIAPEIMEKIFEPFFTTKEIGTGTGLGLSTVISIVKSHQGVLEVQSEVGKGTCFNIYIPAVAPQEPSEGAKTSRQLPAGHGETIMIVDDEAPFVEILKTTLNEFGYQVLTAHHGAEALSVAMRHSGKIHLAIMDMMMPVMDGPKAMVKLRELRPEVRFMAMSGLQQPEKFQEQLPKEDIVFMAKPLNTDTLLQNIRQALVPPGAPTDSPEPLDVATATGTAPPV